MQRLRQAKASYQVVPTLFLTPFVYKMTHLMILKPRKRPEKAFFKWTALACVVYNMTVFIRDATYWPIVT